MVASSGSIVDTTFIRPGLEPATPPTWTENFTTVLTGRFIRSPLRSLAIEDGQKEKNKASFLIKQTTYHFLRYNYASTRGSFLCSLNNPTPPLPPTHYFDGLAAIVPSQSKT